MNQDSSRPGTVWADLANSPHVLVLEPLARAFGRRGYEVAFTARPFAQTLELSRLRGLNVETVGPGGTGRRASKGPALVLRAWRLASWARRHRLDLAVSHNSYAQILAARWLGIPAVTLMDFEATPANHLAFRLAGRILLPEALRGEPLHRYGATKTKVRYLPGLKEQLYLTPEAWRRARPPEWMAALRAGGRQVVALARPPADFAVYHRFQNTVFEAWIESAAARTDTAVVVLPRNEAQARRAAELRRRLPGLVLPPRVEHALDLLRGADLVVSAGGTMNREAAVAGVPAYSMFAGELPAVDRWLQERGRLIWIRDPGSLHRIRLEPRGATKPWFEPGLADRVMDAVLETQPRRSGR